MTYHLEKPDQGASYVMQGEKDYKKETLCTVTCLEETEGCKGYDLSIVFGGCMYLSNVSGKCMRPPEVKKK